MLCLNGRQEASLQSPAEVISDLQNSLAQLQAKQEVEVSYLPHDSGSDIKVGRRWKALLPKDAKDAVVDRNTLNAIPSN